MLRDVPVAALKFIPHQKESAAWALPQSPDESVARDAGGLPIPTDDLLVGYADSAQVYLESGRLHVRTMLDLLHQSGFSLPAPARILDFGCGIGRMIRALDDQARQGEVWGVDISATPIHWCKTHLSPPFRFATTTTIPHLPFPDGFFDLVYAASVFTHVEDLADAWLCEVRRILAPAGRAYVTIHDDSTLELLNSVYADHWLGQMVRSSPAYQGCGGRYGMLVIDRDTASQVFYAREFFLRTLAPTFEVLGVHPGVHGYQTAYVLRPKG